MEAFISTSIGMVLLFALVLWMLWWKGVALWRAAHREEKKWFVALLIFNTLSVLEILYVFVFSKQKENKEPQK
ncbi:MAG: hypothetical protein HYT49_03830 [Candidatus Wildermuthbacteria bacterium]|nr:hypothetical protein [Candidatus Wildermuthbacteria bacterium]